MNLMYRDPRSFSMSHDDRGYSYQEKRNDLGETSYVLHNYLCVPVLMTLQAVEPTCLLTPPVDKREKSPALHLFYFGTGSTIQLYQPKSNPK